eukprot:286643-Rhodomonas_salina.2
MEKEAPITLVSTSTACIRYVSTAHRLAAYAISKVQIPHIVITSPEQRTHSQYREYARYRECAVSVPHIAIAAYARSVPHIAYHDTLYQYRTRRSASVGR